MLTLVRRPKWPHWITVAPSGKPRRGPSPREPVLGAAQPKPKVRKALDTSETSSLTCSDHTASVTTLTPDDGDRHLPLEFRRVDERTARDLPNERHQTTGGLRGDLDGLSSFPEVQAADCR